MWYLIPYSKSLSTTIGWVPFVRNPKLPIHFWRVIASNNTRNKTINLKTIWSIAKTLTYIKNSFIITKIKPFNSIRSFYKRRLSIYDWMIYRLNNSHKKQIDWSWSIENVRLAQWEWSWSHTPMSNKQKCTRKDRLRSKMKAVRWSVSIWICKKKIKCWIFAQGREGKPWLMHINWTIQDRFISMINEVISWIKQDNDFDEPIFKMCSSWKT